MLTPPTQRVFGLDLLRAVAISAVLAAHLWPFSVGGEVGTAMGILGVELFFVLSGFLIGGILIRQVQTGEFDSFHGVLEFLKRRWLRTLPTYYLFLLLQIAWRQSVLGFPDVFLDQLSWFVFLQDPLSYFFPESWSLVVEEWFYLLFALSLFLALHVLPKKKLLWVIVPSLFLVVPLILRAVASSNLAGQPAVDLTRVWDGYLRKSATFRLDAIMYGVIAANLAYRYDDLWRRWGRFWPVAILLLTLAGLSLVTGFPIDRSEAFQGFLLWPLISLSFACLLPWASRCRRPILGLGKVVGFMARISYSLYLCHGLVVLILKRFCSVGSSLSLVKNTLSWSVVALLTSVFIASLAYRFFEKPMMDLRDRKPSRL